jgi:hypothetical protein
MGASSLDGGSGSKADTSRAAQVLLSVRLLDIAMRDGDEPRLS